MKSLCSLLPASSSLFSLSAVGPVADRHSSLSNSLLPPPPPTSAAVDLSGGSSPAALLATERLVLRNHKLLRDLSTFAVGGPCSFFLEATRPSLLLSAARLAQARSLPLLVLGRGSNCLFSDQGFDGLVVLNRSVFGDEDDAGVQVVGPGRFRACSGYPFNRLGVRTAAEGWGGLEFAGGIPGTVGGATFMNAGADGQETAEVVESVEVVMRDGDFRVLTREEVRYGYRWSSLQEMDDMAAIVAVTFRLSPAPAARDRQRKFLAR
ncbi:hypothetical protein AXF42_Ash005624 [Apostasia shenzhenica]|uniref:FAD-binding PCMH-type domain-containing protein n=1 Tax=Apostasia shenzhenica TaxID=1088818 RepID=A0A2I0BBX5_9ASPA|nr:hypothetical protein AXF42_Ash005624 [Apostasia shenzhenica]